MQRLRMPLERPASAAHGSSRTSGRIELTNKRDVAPMVIHAKVATIGDTKPCTDCGRGIKMLEAFGQGVRSEQVVVSDQYLLWRCDTCAAYELVVTKQRLSS